MMQISLHMESVEAGNGDVVLWSPKSDGLFLAVTVTLQEFPNIPDKPLVSWDFFFRTSKELRLLKGAIDF